MTCNFMLRHFVNFAFSGSEFAATTDCEGGGGSLRGEE